MAISDPGRGLVRRLGVTAAALLAFAAASQQRAEALSLASPGTAPSAKFATDDLTTEVRHGGHGGGGGGFVAVEAAVSRRRWRVSWRWIQGRRCCVPWRRVQRRRHCDPSRRLSRRAGVPWRRHARRADIATSITGRTSSPPASFPSARSTRRRYYGYPYSYGYRHRYCRVIWTYYGPRKICRYRPWYRHHWRVRYYGSPYRYW